MVVNLENLRNSEYNRNSMLKHMVLIVGGWTRVTGRYSAQEASTIVGG